MCASMVNHQALDGWQDLFMYYEMSTMSDVEKK